MRGKHNGNSKHEKRRGSKGDAFYNVYNFVRSCNIDVRNPARHWNRPESEEGKNNKNKEFFSGILNCELKTITPMFIADHKNKDDKNKVDFFNAEGDYMIPATSIKGMLRSVFETVTNSCFLFANKDESDFEGYRDISHSRPQDIKGGVIIELPDENNPGYILKAELAQVKKGVAKKFQFSPYTQHDVTGQIYINERGKKIVNNLKPLKDSVSQNKGLFGILWVSGDMPMKKHETVFIFNYGKRKFNCVSELVNWAKMNKERLLQEKKLVLFSHLEKYKYEHIYRHGGMAKKKDYRLKEGNVVYFEKYNAQAFNIRRAQIGKYSFKNSISTLLTGSERPCGLEEIQNNKICPACEVFGLTSYENQKETKKNLARAGRIIITNALPEGKLEFDKSYPMLKTLATPHPSCTAFYLLKKDGTVPKPVKPEEFPVYDKEKYRLRGRKFYLFRTEALQEKAYEEENLQKYQMDNNIQAHLLKNGKFKFDIYFHGLTDYELGALIFSLELDNKAYNAIGAGKPFGLGAVEIKVNDIQVINKERYKTLTVMDEQFGLKSYNECKEMIVEEYKDWICQKCKVNKFEEIEFIRELLSIRKNDGWKGKVEYPRKNEKGFKWFMVHTTKNSIKKRQFQSLPLAGSSEKLKDWS